MQVRRSFVAALSVAVLAGGAVLASPATAGADGITTVSATCSGIPIIGSTTADVQIEANDDVDPVAVGGTVTNTLKVPVPVGDVPLSVTVNEVKITVPIPTGVTVTDVTFTPSSFSNQTWSISGSNLVATLTGSVPLGGSAPPPQVPQVSVKTTVAGPPRTIQWRVPTSITARANAGFPFGTINVTCTPSNLNTVLITTTVVAPNQAPVATDQTVPVAFDTPTAVTLAGTDPDGDALTYAVASQPAQGTLSGTAPNLTYTPNAGYVGADAFTFTVSDGTLSDTGTVTLEVSEAATTVPGSPAIGSVVPAEGQVALSWSPPSNDGGEPVTAYVVTPVAAGVPQSPIEILPPATATTVTGLANGVAHTFRVAAVNSIGTGPAATSSSVTPQWWLPWSSGPVAVSQIFTWLTGSGPTTAQRTSWLAQLDAGTALPGDLVAALRTGADATNNVDPTVRLYSAYLTRVPDASGLNFWLNRRRTGWTLYRISNFFADSSEFKNRYGSLGNRAFVELIYQNVMERTGDPGGITFWTNQLNNRRYNRGQVMINFSESNEYQRRQAENTDAAAIFIHLLGKTPTRVERDAFADALRGGATVAELVRDQIHLPAFANRAG